VKSPGVSVEGSNVPFPGLHVPPVSGVPFKESNKLTGSSLGVKVIEPFSPASASSTVIVKVVSSEPVVH